MKAAAKLCIAEAYVLDYKSTKKRFDRFCKEGSSKEDSSYFYASAPSALPAMELGLQMVEGIETLEAERAEQVLGLRDVAAEVLRLVRVAADGDDLAA